MSYFTQAVFLSLVLTLVTLAMMWVFPRSYSSILSIVNRLLLALVAALVLARYAHELALLVGVHLSVFLAVELAVLPVYSALLLTHLVVNRHYFTAPLAARWRNSHVGLLTVRIKKKVSRIIHKQL